MVPPPVGIPAGPSTNGKLRPFNSWGMRNPFLRSLGKSYDTFSLQKRGW